MTYNVDYELLFKLGVVLFLLIFLALNKYLYSCILDDICKIYDSLEEIAPLARQSKNALQKEICYVEASIELDCNYSTVVVDASKQPIELTLPPAKGFAGFLSIVCYDCNFPVKIVPDASDRILDESNVELSAKGDCVTFKPSSDAEPDGFWFAIARYNAKRSI